MHMEQNNKNGNGSNLSSDTKYLIIAGVAIIVVIALAIIVPHLKKPVVAPTTDTAVPAVSDTTKTPSATDSGKLSADSWTALLKEYTGRVVVLGADCMATPTTLEEGLGTKVLLANNSDVAHTVIFGNNTGYTIGARHYKTALVANTGNTIISCDANQKAATIIVK